MVSMALAGSQMPPNSTVYVRNLHERIKPEQLRESLIEIFSEYGNIIDIVARRNLKAKGQAFIVFDSVEAASNAIEEIQGFELFDKPMVLDFAKTKSDATVQREATDDEFEAHKRRRLADKERKQAAEAAGVTKQLKRANVTSVESSGPRPIKASRGAGLKASNPAGGAVIPEEYLPPNKILFVQNLPDDYGVDALTAIFARFEGFKEVRLVPGRKGIAFVEYHAETGAISAKESTSGMGVGSDARPMKVVFQRQ